VSNTTTHETRNVNARHILGIDKSKWVRNPHLVAINGYPLVGGWLIEGIGIRDIDVSDTEWIELSVWVGHNMIGITLHPANDSVTVEFDLIHDDDDNDSHHGSAVPLF
jgi:hypothetical protein